MRRTWLGALALFVATCALTPAHARRGDPAYQGTWKLTLLQLNNGQEVSIWLLKVDKDGKVIEVAGGQGRFAQSKVSGVRASAEALRFTLQGPGPRDEFFVAAAPGKARDTLLGTLRSGYDFLPMRLEKTELKELTSKNAQLSMTGRKDLEEAVKTVDPVDKMKALRDVLKANADQPIAMIASHVLLFELLQAKGEVDDFKSAAAAYYRAATPYGREMQLQAAKLLSQLLVSYEKSRPQGVEYARKAVGLLSKDDDRGVRMTTYISLAQVLNKAAKKDAIGPVADKIKEIAEDAIKNPRGKATEQLVTLNIAAMLLRSGVDAIHDLGLDFARRGHKSLKADAPLGERLAVLKLLRVGLVLRGKTDEVKGVAAEIEKLETKLDADYLAEAVPFKVDKIARKAKGDRTVLVELFSNANVPNCIAADVAFDAARKAYSPREALLLNYQIPFPKQSPPPTLVNPDTVARAKFYDDIENVPVILVDGEAIGTPLGGSAAKAGEASFGHLRKAIDTALQSEPEARIRLEAKRDGDKVEVTARVDQLREAGATIKLRLLLVEEVVRYPGGSGRRLHHHVVRAILGGNDGFKLEKKESSHTTSVELPALFKSLHAYLNQLGQNRPFANAERPMLQGRLQVIALVQDDITRKVFQAAVVDVPAAAPKPQKKEEKKEP